MSTEFIIFIIIIVVVLSYWYWVNDEKIWVEYSYRVKMYIIAEVNDLHSKRLDLLKLIQVQNKLIKSISSSYGGHTLTKKYMIKHLQIIQALAKTRSLTLIQKLNDNIKDLSYHLSCITNKDFVTLHYMLYKYLGITQKEIDILFADDWMSAIQYFDNIKLNMVSFIIVN